MDLFRSLMIHWGEQISMQLITIDGVWIIIQTRWNRNIFNEWQNYQSNVKVRIINQMRTWGISIILQFWNNFFFFTEWSCYRRVQDTRQRWMNSKRRLKTIRNSWKAYKKMSVQRRRLVEIKKIVAWKAKRECNQWLK